jgi:hypothetical protein
MKITKDQEKIVLNALTDSYLAIENELLGVGKEKYEYVPSEHWRQLKGIKGILEANKKLLSEWDMNIIKSCEIFLKEKREKGIK